LAKGLDPKHELTVEHVTIIDIASFFGNVKTFKTTNLLFPLDIRKEMETLYWKINGTNHITNNELMVWFVKGWIANRMNIQLNGLKLLLLLQRKRLDAWAMAQ
jgi:uncharacterized protein YycO